MKTLWFKGSYVGPILTGEKRQTYRHPDRARCYRAGEIIGASVGPRPAFATLHLDAVELIPFNELPSEEQRDATETYPGVTALACLRFHTV